MKRSESGVSRLNCIVNDNYLPAGKRLIWTHPFVDFALRMRLFSCPSLVNGVEEFSVEMESYLVCFLHDTAVGSVAGHCPLMLNIRRV